MSYTLAVNRKTYIVTDHTALRMLERYVTDAMIVDTIEQGDWSQQENGRDRYEREVILDGQMALLIVIVDEQEQRIITLFVRPF